VTEDELKQIEERAAKATDGPWRFEAGPSDQPNCQDIYAGDGNGPIAMTEPGVYPLGSKHGVGKTPLADAAFIAAAREDVPKLVAEVRRLSGEAERLRDELAVAKDMIKEAVISIAVLKAFSESPGEPQP
jgi:hypothetical protein